VEALSLKFIFILYTMMSLSPSLSES